MEEAIMRIKWIFTALLVIIFGFSITAVEADAKYPEKEVRIIVNYGAGGGVDRTARSVQRFLPDALGVSVLVENHKGAGGKIGYKYYLKQKKNPYNILCAFIPALTNVGIKEPGLFNPKDLAYINVQWSDPAILVARKELPFDTLEEFIEYAKKNPGKLAFSISGKGAVGYLLSDTLFKKMGLKINMVPYAGGGKARAAIQGGHVQLTAAGAGTMLTVKEIVKPLGVFWNKPVMGWPGAKPINESLKKYNVTAPVGAAYRFFAVHKETKQKYPQEFKTLVEAFKKTTTENKDFIDFSDKSMVGRDWYGPDETEKILIDAHREFEKILSK
jgi:tripartite-type tricarboxylate transporter receptor subunit TctC